MICQSRRLHVTWLPRETAGKKKSCLSELEINVLRGQSIELNNFRPCSEGRFCGYALPLFESALNVDVQWLILPVASMSDQ